MNVQTLWGVVYLGLVLTFLLRDLPLYGGQLSESSDAYMHAAQILDFIQSGNWFHTEIARYDPPGINIYSRLSDLPYALFAGPLSSLMPAREAVLASAFLVSLFIWVPLYLWLSLWLTRGLSLGLWARFAPLAAVYAGTSFGLMKPGEIDHHNLQILLFMGMLGYTARFWTKGYVCRWGDAARFGLLGALSLAIGAEGLMTTGFICACLTLRWLLLGRSGRPFGLIRAGLLLPVWVALLLVLLRYPQNYIETVSYRLSCLQLVLACGVGLVWEALELCDRKGKDLLCRGGCAGLVGVFIVGFLYLIAPDFLFTGVWFGVASEFKQLIVAHTDELSPVFSGSHVGWSCGILVGILVSLVGYGVGAARVPDQRPFFALLVVWCVGMGFGGLFLAYRLEWFAGCALIPGLLLAAQEVDRRLCFRWWGKWLAGAGLVLLGGPFMAGLIYNHSLTEALFYFAPRLQQTSQAAQNMALYLNLPQVSDKRLRLLGGFHSGPEILFRTDHLLIGGGYYPSYGMQVNADFYKAETWKQAAQLLQDNQIDYVVFDPSDSRGRFPGRFDIAARLLTEKSPFLSEVDIPSFGVLHLYRVDQPALAAFLSDQQPIR